MLSDDPWVAIISRLRCEDFQKKQLPPHEQPTGSGTGEMEVISTVTFDLYRQQQPDFETRNPKWKRMKEKKRDLPVINK